MPNKQEYQNRKEYYDNYRKNNKEYWKEYRKSYDKEKRHRTSKKSEWRRSYKMRGVNDELYDIYRDTKYCDYCNIELSEGKKITSNRKCMEHNHATGYYRAISCHSCNNKMRIIDKIYSKVIDEIKSKVS